MLEDFFGSLVNSTNVNSGNITQYSPLALAYIGDSVYEVFIRTLIISEGNAPVHVMHRKSVDYVKAKAQSDIIHKITHLLTPEEQDIVRRGRNAKSGTVPKNADVNEYRYATGFECLVGYLYLKGDYTRLVEVLKMAICREV